MRTRGFCAHCTKPYVKSAPNQRYCGDACRKTMAKKQNAEWERNNPRPPHLYRNKKVKRIEAQFEFIFEGE